MRRSLSLLVIATLAATALAGCSSSSADATCTYDEKTGDGVSAVSVNDSFGSAPDAIFATPLKASTNQNVIVSEGDGLVSHAGDTVAVDVSLYDGTTAELLSSTNYDGSGFALLPLDATAQPALAKALECVQVGSRVVAVIGDAPNLTTALELAAGTGIEHDGTRREHRGREPGRAAGEPAAVVRQEQPREQRDYERARGVDRKPPHGTTAEQLRDDRQLEEPAG